MKQTTLLALSLAAKLLTVGMVALGTVLMMSGAADGASLTARGLKALRYFTVLSNLLMGLAALIYAVSLVRALRGDGAVPIWTQTLLLVAAASVGLTFLVVAGFFVPFLHAKDMFVGANFWFHLVIPLFSLLSYVLLDRFALLPRRAVLLAAAPMLLYGLAYAVNCLVNGVGDYTNRAALNDWYWFLYWGYPAGLAFFAGLAGVTLGLGALLRLGNQAGQAVVHTP